MINNKSVIALSIVLVGTVIFGNTHYNNKLDKVQSKAYAEYQNDVKEESIKQKKQKLNNIENLLSLKDNTHNDLMDSVEIRNVESNLFEKLNEGEKATIVFLGDSTTEHNGYTNGKPGHVEVVRDELTKIYPNLTVINSGISGNTIEDMNNRLDKSVINYRPDLVIINSGINDVGHDVSSEEFESTYKKSIERIQKETDAKIILRTSNLTLGKETNDLLEERVNPKVKSLAERYDLGFIDVYNYYEAVTSNDPKGIEKYNFNYSHPNEIGQSEIADIVLYTILMGVKEN